VRKGVRKNAQKKVPLYSFAKSFAPFAFNHSFQTMKIKVGVMGSAEEASATLHEKAMALGRAIAGREVILLTGATTGLVHEVGKAAHDAGAFHIGISPADDEREHVEQYGFPTDACNAIIHTGFGLKGRNVVLVRSCDIVLIVAGSIGSLNEFTIAYDEGKVIGCLTGTGGVADEIEKFAETFQKQAKARIVYDDDPVRLLDECMAVRQAGTKPG
jgi:uncharacterized protein (TIGR00725 family)